MTEMQHMVAAFTRKMQQYTGDRPAIPEPDIVSLRNRLTQREAGEFQEAMFNGDIVGAIAELCDILFVCFGNAEALGVDIMPFFTELFCANMRKEYRSDIDNWKGGVVKPEGWKPPDIQSMLDACNAFIECWSNKDAYYISVCRGDIIILKNGMSGEIFKNGPAENEIILQDTNPEDGYVSRFSCTLDEISWRNTWGGRYRRLKYLPWPSVRQS